MPGGYRNPPGVNGPCWALVERERGRPGQATRPLPLSPNRTRKGGPCLSPSPTPSFPLLVGLGKGSPTPTRSRTPPIPNRSRRGGRKGRGGEENRGSAPFPIWIGLRGGAPTLAASSSFPLWPIKAHLLPGGSDNPPVHRYMSELSRNLSDVQTLSNIPIFMSRPFRDSL